MKFLIYLTDKRNRNMYYIVLNANGTARLTDDSDKATLFTDPEKALAEKKRIERQYDWLHTTNKEIVLADYQMIVGLGRKVWSEVWYNLLQTE